MPAYFSRNYNGSMELKIHYKFSTKKKLSEKKKKELLLAAKINKIIRGKIENIDYYKSFFSENSNKTIKKTMKD